MTGDVALTTALRSNLLSLQDTQRLIDRTQVRLSTGKKVNTALDNPLNFFRAQAFQDRASDLSRLLDGIGLSIRTVEEADKGIKAITNLLDTAEALIDQAKAAYNGTSTTVATITGLHTAGGVATTGETIANLLGAIEGFNATSGDSITVSIDGNAVTVNGNDTLGDLIAAFETGGLLTTSYNSTTGNLVVSVAGGDSGFSLLDEVTITITDDDGSGTVSDPSVNFGGVIVRESAGETNIYKGLMSELANLEERYNKIRTEISAIANDAEYNGINLLKGNDLLTIFNEEGTSNLTTIGQDLTTFGLGMSFADFSTRTLLYSNAAELDVAITTVRNFGNSIATDISLIQNRETFTRETIQTLKGGADDLTLADLNEEGANLLALQTRQQLGVTSLSLASDAQASVLRLF